MADSVTDQMKKLKKYLNKPIKHFDVILDRAKGGGVWNYYGELAFKNPVSRDIVVVDSQRFYCLKCIQDVQKKDPATELLHSSISSMKFPESKGPDHLSKIHDISVENSNNNPIKDKTGPTSSKSKTTIEIVTSDDDGTMEHDENQQMETDVNAKN